MLKQRHNILSTDSLELMGNQLKCTLSIFTCIAWICLKAYTYNQKLKDDEVLIYQDRCNINLKVHFV